MNKKTFKGQWFRLSESNFLNHLWIFFVCEFAHKVRPSQRKKARNCVKKRPKESRLLAVSFPRHILVFITRNSAMFSSHQLCSRPAETGLKWWLSSRKKCIMWFCLLLSTFQCNFERWIGLQRKFVLALFVRILMLLEDQNYAETEKAQEKIVSLDWVPHFTIELSFKSILLFLNYFSLIGMCFMACF